MPEFQQGDRVFHPKKGVGVVDSNPQSAGVGCGHRYAVQFNSGERTKVRESNLTKVTEGHTKELATLDDVVADAVQRDLNQEHARELRTLVAAEKRQRRIEETLRETLVSYDATPLARITETRGKPEHEDILVLSDWHVGLKLTFAETGGLYEQDTATTREQVAKIWSAVEQLHLIRASGRNVSKLHILFLGDLVEGSGMRSSQARKVDTVVTEQTVNGFDMLAWVVRMALQVYPSVEVEIIGGNHDRVSPRPGDAGLGELSYVDNYSWLAGAFLERALENDVSSGRLFIRNWKTFFGFKEVRGVKTVFEHGSSFKWSMGSYGGVPWYAISQLSPKYTTMLGAADLICIGHGHRPSLLPQGRGWILSNGALPPTSTYIQAGQKVISRPTQWLLSVHADHGITDWSPLYADVPGMPSGVWDDPDYFASLAS